MAWHASPGLTIDQVGAGYTWNATAGNLSATTTSAIASARGGDPTGRHRAAARRRHGGERIRAGGRGRGLVRQRGHVLPGQCDRIPLAGAQRGRTRRHDDAHRRSTACASLSDLTLTRAVAGDSLQIAAGGLSSATTNPFAVNPAAPTQVVLISQPPGKIPAHQSFRFAAAVEDPFGNIVTDYNGPSASPCRVTLATPGSTVR